MTRDAFIASYMKWSGVTEYSVEGEKVSFGDSVRYALPCYCGEEGCKGWAMVGEANREDHLARNKGEHQ